MSDFKPNDRISFNNEVYNVVKEDAGNSLIVKRTGSNTPITIPADQAKKIFQEGRSDYDSNRRLNG